MTIDDRALNRFLDCKYKAYLSACGASSQRTEYDIIEEKQSETTRDRFKDSIKVYAILGVLIASTLYSLQPKVGRLSSGD